MQGEETGEEYLGSRKKSLLWGDLSLGKSKNQGIIL